MPCSHATSLLPCALTITAAAVPREARLEIDVRDIDGTRRDGVVAAIRAKAAEIADKRKVGSCLRSCCWWGGHRPRVGLHQRFT